MALIGALNINKPLGLTSHDVVARARRRYRQLGGAGKVGHAGTLDPLADGALVLLLGGATRLSDFLMAGAKVYRAQVAFGATTTSYDAEGMILSQADASGLSRADIEAALPAFIGEIDQTPPLYSAIKVGGKKLYEYARGGQFVERKARRVLITGIDLVAWRAPVATLEVRCGSGTYIRSLAHDLGQALGVGAHLSGLTRLASGSFTIEDSVALADALAADDWTDWIISPYAALDNWTRVFLDDPDVQALRQGRFVRRRDDVDDTQVFAFDRRRGLVALLEPRDDLWKPRKVFPAL